MKMSTLRPLRTSLVAMSFLSAASAYAQVQASKPHPDGTAEIARQAYIYGYPLVAMGVTRRVLTNTVSPTDAHAPINQVAHLMAFPTAAFKAMVAPNVNTLYSSAWIDLSDDPMIIHMPDTKGRYYVMEILDAWTNVIAAPGKRTTGTGEQTIALIGPGAQDQMPPGITHTHYSPTNIVWVINRIQTDGPKDYPVVNAIQRGITLTPLSRFGKSYTPPPGRVNPAVDMKTPPVRQVNMMSAEEFFTMLSRELMLNKPAPADSMMVKRMMSIGIVPGHEFKMPKSEALAREVKNGARMGLASIEKYAKTMGLIRNGWQTLNACGQFGMDYITRAAVAMAALGCNLPQDALYPMTMVDMDNKPLMGSNQYVVHFPAGQLPPVNAFWSLTLYDGDMFLVHNALNRYALSSYDSLKENADGSLDLYIQRDSPGPEMTSNWLPAPEGRFVLMMRLYWPGPEAISGQWGMPGVRMVP